MLSPLDETLRHQLPTTYDHAGTSDPRFFDRYWFAIYDPAGAEPVLNAGMCSYLNMNVVDGYAAMILNGKQHNLRLSRALRPALYTADPQVSVLGPLRVSVLESFRRLRLELQPNDHGLAYELEWSAVLAPHEELPNFSRVRGRVNQEYVRYNQSGRVDGWIELAGKRFEVRDWWGGRDHSWGTRPDVAGPEPHTGEDAAPFRGGAGFLWSWVTFGTDAVGGHVQLQQLSDGTPTHAEAMLRWPEGAGRQPVRANEIDLEFDVYPATRRFSRASFSFDADGAEPGRWRIDMEPISRSLAMLGLGYSLGYADRRGHGVYRGAYHEEFDVYDVSHDEDVVLPDGNVERPYHRDCAVRVRVTSPGGTTVAGAGHAAILPMGSLPQFGLG
jgi:hypothetical protein